MNLSRIGLDLAKQVFQVHGVDRHEHVVCRRQLKRAQVRDFFRQLPPCLVAMEACGSAHYWARELRELGHTVRLIAPQFVKPYVKGDKHDAHDAEAICEAASRPSMRYVPVKSAEQQAVQSVHRVRSRLVRARTALCNEVRGLLMLPKRCCPPVQSCAVAPTRPMPAAAGCKVCCNGVLPMSSPLPWPTRMPGSFGPYSAGRHATGPVERSCHTVVETSTTIAQ